MNMMTWLRRKWRQMVPGRVYILGTLGTPTGGIVANVRPFAARLSSRPPDYEPGWTVRWQWLTGMPRGVEIDHPDSAYIVVRVAADAPPGRGEIECVYTRDGREHRSAPCSITVLAAPDNDSGSTA